MSNVSPFLGEDTTARLASGNAYPGTCMETDVYPFSEPTSGSVGVSLHYRLDKYCFGYKLDVTITLLSFVNFTLSIYKVHHINYGIVNISN